MNICHSWSAPSLRISIVPVPRPPRGIPDRGKMPCTAFFRLVVASCTRSLSSHDWNYLETQRAINGPVSQAATHLKPLLADPGAALSLLENVPITANITRERSHVKGTNQQMQLFVRGKMKKRGNQTGWRLKSENVRAVPLTFSPLERRSCASVVFF